MSNLTHCESCGSAHRWSWEEAFDKFGFGDGDSLIMTSVVADVLGVAGYDVETQHWGLHNVIIVSIRRNGVSLIPATAIIGYDEPRGYLPDEIVKLLDEKLSGVEV